MLRVGYIHLVTRITPFHQFYDRSKLSFIHVVFLNNFVVECIRNIRHCSVNSSLTRTCVQNNITELQTFEPPSKRNNMSVDSNATELEVSCYISTGEFTFEESSSSLIEEQRSTFFLRQLRYEEYAQDGLQKKRECMQGINGRLCIKVMSYNVLSQQLLEQHRFLYRNQTADVLRWDYRHPRLLTQILLEDPDVLCLQEVQESHIPSFYNKLEDFGYKGVFKKRTGGKADGCAVYFRSCLFDLTDWTTVEYFQPRVSVLNRDNVGLVVRLRPKGGAGRGDFVVATTHLLYNPRRDDVRLAQLQIFLAEVHRLARNKDGCGECGVIMTGDLNANPESPVVRLIMEGFLDNIYPPLPSHLGVLPNCKHADVTSPKLYNSDKREKSTPTESQPPSPERRKPSTLQRYSLRSNVSHQFNFHSAYVLRDGDNSIATTFQDEWITVDYVFYSCCEQIQLLSRLRLPTKSECSKFIRNLPNYASPSDHLPLAATFSLKID